MTDNYYKVTTPQGDQYWFFGGTAHANAQMKARAFWFMAHNRDNRASISIFKPVPGCATNEIGTSYCSKCGEPHRRVEGNKNKLLVTQLPRWVCGCP